MRPHKQTARRFATPIKGCHDKLFEGNRRGGAGDRCWNGAQSPKVARCLLDHYPPESGLAMLTVSFVGPDPFVWSGRALQEDFVDLADVRSCINVSGL
jgi:hypothetical protein